MQKITVKQFGPIKNATLELKSINLLIGEQSIGKSTMAKLIAIFTDNVSLAVIATSGIKSWNNRLKLYDLDIYSDNDYHIKYSLVDADYSLTISITKNRINTSLYVNGVQIKGKKEIGAEIVKKRRLFNQDTFMTNIADELKAFQNNEDKRYQVLSLQSLIESSLYVPAERSSFSMNDNLKNAFVLLGESASYTFMRFMVSLDKARLAQRRYESSILNITYLNEEKGQFFIDGNSKKKYHLFNASSGIQSAIPLLLVLNDINKREYSSIVIEEPETNLFPNKQVDLLKLILQKSQVEGRIITITTHSPYLLSAMNNFLYAGYISRHLQKTLRPELNSIIPADLWLSSEDCAVYSIGEFINGGQVYCKSIIDNEIGMIDANTLDRVSFSLSEQFTELQDVYLKGLN